MSRATPKYLALMALSAAALFWKTLFTDLAAIRGSLAGQTVA